MEKSPEQSYQKDKKYCLSLETKYFICFSYFTYTIFKSNLRE